MKRNSLSSARGGVRATIAMTMVLAVGCGRDIGFPVAPVQGTVLYRDQPLPGGTVVFHPQSPTPGPQAIGKVQPDGTFRMTVAGVDGAAVGDHLVTVDYRRKLTEEESRNLVIPELLIPRQYASVVNSPLRFTVKQSSQNEYSIVLTDP